MTLYTFHELEQNRFFHWKEKLASCFDVSYCMSIQRSIFFTLQSWEPSKKGSDIVSYLKKCMTRLLITMLVNVLFTCAANCLVASASRNDRDIISQIYCGLGFYTKEQFKMFEIVVVIKLWIGLNYNLVDCEIQWQVIWAKSIKCVLVFIQRTVFIF